MLNTKEVERLHTDLNIQFSCLESRFMDIADSLLKLVIASGYRFVCINDRYYMVNANHVIDIADEERIQELKELHMCFTDTRLFSMIWGQVHWDIVSMIAMKVADLMNEAQLDSAEYNPLCNTVPEEIDLVRRLYNSFGPDFFQMQEDGCEIYAEYISSLDNQELKPQTK